MVKKRKNNEEIAVAVPRLTRQRRILREKGDPNSTAMEKTTKLSRTRKTPSTEGLRTRNGSRKALITKSLSDSDLENIVEEPKHTINEEEIPDVESYPTRSRAKKDGNAINQDLINLTIQNKAEASLLAERKRQTKKKKILTAADNTLNKKPSELKTPLKLTRSQTKTGATTISQTSDAPELLIKKIAKTSSIQAENAKTLSLRRIVETPKKVSPRRQSNSLLILPTNTVTPESSPMLVNLTPHRSTKTPKKSPMNINSPKTHAQSPLRLSKTPRKLPVAIESPATSDKSSVSLSNQSPLITNFQNESLLDSYVVLTDFKKEPWLRTEQTIKPEEASESPPSFISVAKMKLRKPGGTSLSPGSKSLQKSVLTVDEIWAEVSAMSPRRKSPSKKPATLASKIRKSPVKTPASIRKVGSATPGKTRSFSLSRKSPKIIPTTAKITPTTVKPLNLANPESPRRPKSMMKKRSPITSSGTPLRPIALKEEIPSAKLVPSLTNIAPMKIKMLSELVGSSPESTSRGRIRRSLHLTPDFIKFSSCSTSSPISTPKKTDRMPLSLCIENLEKSKMIDDESLELVDASTFMNISDDVFSNSVTPMDGTYELSKESILTKEDKNQGEKSSDILEKTEVNDATYELAEPKTPSLKKTSRKRSLSNIEPDKCTPEAKKRCRVRFASPAKDKIPSSLAGSVRKSLPAVKTPAKQRIGSRLSERSAVLDSSRRRSRSLNKIDGKTAATSTTVKRRSISASNLSNKTPKLNQSSQNSKLDIKPPVARKAPNFAQIHQKKFAEMESLVDAKKRVAKRHEELNAMPSTRALQSAVAVVPELSVPQSSKKPAPSDAHNGPFNRFGFKLRKAEAIKVISKNPAAASRSNNLQENNRMILKGVRTNRRFELQMKARNIKQ